MLRDTTMWTISIQGTSPTGARVVLHRSRLGSRYELAVGAAIVGSYGPGESGRAFGDWARACGETQSGGRAA